jgi:hypothetical protein
MGLIGNVEPTVETITIMRERGGTWAAYQDHDLGSLGIGHMKFLRYGEGCTFSEPPKPRLPDTRTEINWRYQFAGLVNVETGKIEEVKP